MDYIMTGRELAARCLDIAERRKTIYMYACYGFQVTDETIRKKAEQNLNGWYTDRKIRTLKAAANQTPPVWGFDCVNLIKGILWGWTGDESKERGGAAYASNGVPDTNADGMIKRCGGVSADFGSIAVGEVVWMEGHIGVYVGRGLAVECTPAWANGVQITAVWNIGKIAGFNGRSWTKHGKLPWVDYGGGADGIGPDRAEEPRVLKRGCEGDDVRKLQQALLALGYDLGRWGADGVFGAATEAAVKAYQLNHGLTVTGIAPEGLSAAPDAETDGCTYTVVIRGLTRADADGLMARYPDCVVTAEPCLP